MDRKENLYLRWTTSSEDGGCNFCNRWISHLGQVRHDVLVVGDSGLVVRFCRPCKAQLDAKTFDGGRK